MFAIDYADLLKQAHRCGKAYLETLHVPALSVGLYRLPAGGTDPQLPHDEDEVYYVVTGTAQIAVADEDHPVGPGSLVYVPAQVDHRFHDITEDLEILVFFAPAEGTCSD